MVLRKYTLLIYDSDTIYKARTHGVREKEEGEVLFLLPGWLREIEENLTDLLPDGYRAGIREE